MPRVTADYYYTYRIEESRFVVQFYGPVFFFFLNPLQLVIFFKHFFVYIYISGGSSLVVGVWICRSSFAKRLRFGITFER